MEDKKLSETTVEPEKCLYPDVVKITINNNTINATYPKNEDFRLLVKSLDYVWDSDKRTWTRQIGYRAGKTEDRAAELAHKLLINGFRVRMSNPDILQAAVAGQYEPECKRWVIKYLDSPEKLFITFEKNETLYQAARKLPGSKWENKCVSVPVTEYNSVLDFAELYGFRLSPGAQEEIENYKKSLMIVAPADKKDHEPEDNTEKLKTILESRREVLPDLRDDD